LRSFSLLAFLHPPCYEDPSRQAKARSLIPRQQLEEAAAVYLVKQGQCQPSEAEFRDAVLRHLLIWFKSWFKWVDSPPCPKCHTPTCTFHGNATPSAEDLRWGGQRVELHRCKQCGSTARFVRYNDPAKLLDTREGRCGEWANAFTLCCRALGYDARQVVDWTDHVWTECFSHADQRWLHLDPCEAAFDTPLLYEQGWGKKLTYVFGVGRDGVADIIWRYTRRWDELQHRRTEASESAVAAAVAAVTARARANLSVDERRRLEGRDKQEREDLRGRRGGGREGGREGGERDGVVLGGRQTGSVEWRAARGELGMERGDEGRKGGGGEGSEGKDGRMERRVVDGHIRRLFMAVGDMCRNVVGPDTCGVEAAAGGGARAVLAVAAGAPAARTEPVAAEVAGAQESLDALLSLLSVLRCLPFRSRALPLNDKRCDPFRRILLDAAASTVSSRGGGGAAAAVAAAMAGTASTAVASGNASGRDRSSDGNITTAIATTITTTSSQERPLASSAAPLLSLLTVMGVTIWMEGVEGRDGRGWMVGVKGVGEGEGGVEKGKEDSKGGMEGRKGEGAAAEGEWRYGREAVLAAMAMQAAQEVLPRVKQALAQMRAGSSGGDGDGSWLQCVVQHERVCGGWVTADGENPPNELAIAACDGSLQTKWLHHEGGKGAWMQYRLGGSAPVTVTAYSITSANDCPERDPCCWSLQASTDAGVTWRVLDSQSAVGFSSRHQTRVFPVRPANQSAASLYRLAISAVQDPSCSCLQLACFDLFTSRKLPAQPHNHHAPTTAGAVDVKSEAAKDEEHPRSPVIKPPSSVVTAAAAAAAAAAAREQFAAAVREEFQRLVVEKVPANEAASRALKLVQYRLSQGRQ
ncbi:hypothetical protein CLOP_g16404, partial [Closterium sp. NIES-67]